MCVCVMADIVHAFVCVFYAARYLNIAPAVMGLYQKVSGTAPLLAALKGRFRLFTFSPFDENTTISRFHIFTFSHHQSPETMLSPLISTLRQAEIHELVLSKEEATHADRLRKSDRITIDVDLCRLSCG